WYCRLRVEVDNQTYKVLRLLWTYIRHVLIEYQVHVRTSRVGIGIAGRDGGHATAAADLDALIPLLLLNRAAVDFEVNALVFDNNPANAGLIARFRRLSPHGDPLLQFAPRGRK